MAQPKLAICQQSYLPIWPTQIKCIFTLSSKLCLYGVTKMAVCQKHIAYMAHTDKVYLYSVLKVMPVWQDYSFTAFKGQKLM